MRVRATNIIDIDKNNDHYNCTRSFHPKNMSNSKKRNKKVKRRKKWLLGRRKWIEKDEGYMVTEVGHKTGPKETEAKKHFADV